MFAVIGGGGGGAGGSSPFRGIFLEILFCRRVMSKLTEPQNGKTSFFWNFFRGTNGHSNFESIILSVFPKHALFLTHPIRTVTSI